MTRRYTRHPTAVIDDGAEIGDGAKLWHFCHVMAGARIGAGSSLGQNVFVAATTVIGERCRIQNNVSLYDGVVLEDEVFVGPSAVFTNVLVPRAFVTVPRDEYRKTVVRRGASIGANATIVCGVEIGAFAFVGAGAVVTADIPSHAIALGVPARQSGWVCRCGITRFEGRKGRSGGDSGGRPPEPAGRKRTCHACGFELVLPNETDQTALWESEG